MGDDVTLHVSLRKSNGTTTRDTGSRGSGAERRRARLEGETEEASRSSVVVRARPAEPRDGTQNASRARKRGRGITLDVGEPVPDGAPAEREQDREDSEDGQGVGVQPGGK